MEKRLLVVGSINIDLVACANRLPAPGETILGSSFDVFNGGKGANQAVAIAKLGAPVDMIASLGTDLFTERLLSGLKAAGVDTHAVQMVAGPCGVAHISRADNGENSIIVVSGANRLLSAAYIDAHLETVQQAGMILVQLETPLEAVIRLAEQAARGEDSLDAGSCSRHAVAASFAQPHHLAHAQRNRGANPAGPGQHRSPRRCRKTAGDGGAECSPQAGSQGVFLAGRDCAAQQIPAFPVKAVDTTAAGDCFNAAFAVALTRGKPPATPPVTRPPPRRFRSPEPALNLRCPLPLKSKLFSPQSELIAGHLTSAARA